MTARHNVDIFQTSFRYHADIIQTLFRQQKHTKTMTSVSKWQQYNIQTSFRHYSDINETSFRQQKSDNDSQMTAEHHPYIFQTADIIQTSFKCHHELPRKAQSKMLQLWLWAAIKHTKTTNLITQNFPVQDKRAFTNPQMNDTVRFWSIPAQI